MSMILLPDEQIASVYKNDVEANIARSIAGVCAASTSITAKSCCARPRRLDGRT
jgi:ketol-acid reductoisomerase